MDFTEIQNQLTRPSIRRCPFFPEHRLDEPGSCPLGRPWCSRSGTGHRRCAERRQRPPGPQLVDPTGCRAGLQPGSPPAAASRSRGPISRISPLRSSSVSLPWALLRFARRFARSTAFWRKSNGQTTCSCSGERRPGYWQKPIGTAISFPAVILGIGINVAPRSVTA